MSDKDLELQAKEMALILKLHGIELKIEGCGCCGSPGVSFKYKGDTIVDNVDNFNFDSSEYTKE